MRNVLLQRRGLTRRRYTLVEDGIAVTVRSPTSGRTITVPYDTMFGNPVEVFAASRRALIAAVVMAVAAVVCVFAEADPYAWLFWGVLATVAAAYYWESREEQIGFVDGGNKIFFLCDRPSRAAVHEFVSGARDRAREKVRARILPLRCSDDARADLERAEWLRDKAVITDDEYVEFAREVAHLAPPSRSAESMPN